MPTYVGTSGFAYDFWKGDVYPDDVKAPDMLEHYARMANTVEINNTFYRMPKPEVVARWAASVPDDFRFVIKASRRITHSSKLEDAGSVEYLFKVLEPLGDKLGAVLFQCPPFLRKSIERLTRFLAMLPPQARCAIEFRNVSWFDEEVYACLREHGASMCIGDYEGKLSKVIVDGQTPLVATAPWGYLRLREEAYDDAALQHWLDEIRARWSDCYVFFKHEETAPTSVRRFRAAADCAPAGPSSVD